LKKLLYDPLRMWLKYLNKFNLLILLRLFKFMTDFNGDLKVLVFVKLKKVPLNNEKIFP